MAFSKYAEFDGRSRRSEYWYFQLFNLIISTAITFAGLSVDFEYLGSLYSLIVFIPSLSVTVRRLHDTDHSGWSMLIGLIPLVGWIILIVWLAKDGTPGQNAYGLNPKEEGEDFQLYE